MKYIAKIKNKSRFRGGQRHKVPGQGKPAVTAVSTAAPQTHKQPNPSPPHDPEYYHSDNSENRITIGEGDEAQSPHMHYEDE